MVHVDSFAVPQRPLISNLKESQSTNKDKQVPPTCLSATTPNNTRTYHNVQPKITGHLQILDLILPPRTSSGPHWSSSHLPHSTVSPSGPRARPPSHRPSEVRTTCGMVVFLKRSWRRGLGLSPNTPWDCQVTAYICLYIHWGGFRGQCKHIAYMECLG